MERKEKNKILIVDDSEMSRALLAEMLEAEYDIIEAENGECAIDILQSFADEIDLILLDVVMPKMDGFEVLMLMNQYNWIETIPVIMISSESSETYIERAYELGAIDYINRPFEFFIVRRRIRNAVMLYTKQKELLSMVSDMFFEREKSNNMMIDILSHIVEFKNGESGLHVLHIHIVTELLLKQLNKKTDKYNITQSDIRLISLVSALHDIGKIGIPDEILNKPGKLTKEEFEVVKSHTTIGASMLKSLEEYKDEPLIKAAYEVCRWHHERYDGKGYPDGLAGDEIPISAQIVAIADVYDALTNERCYKKAYSHEEAISMIVNGECGTFQPILLECLSEIEADINKEMSRTSSHTQNIRSMNSIMELIDQIELSESERRSACERKIYDIEKTKVKNDEEDEVVDDSKIVKVTGVELAVMITELSKLFKFVRLVDVVGCKQSEIKSDGSIVESNHHCYELWNRNTRCENCISRKSMSKKRQITKLEIIDSEMYCVIANYIEVDGVPCVMELVLEAHDDLLYADKSDKKGYMQINLADYNKRLYTDSLTSAHNRRFYNEKASKWENVDGLAMIDIDDFKNINDQYGHNVGDIVLKKLTATIHSCIRDSDFIIRYGGDEFLLLFPTMAEDNFKNKLEHIKKVVSGMKIDGYPLIKVGISIGGVYGVNPIPDAVKRADMLMYDVKQDGKNDVKI